jgi:ATP-dependent DNA ligase
MQPKLSGPFHRHGWTFEERYDGWRILALQAGWTVRPMSARGVDHATRFPGGDCRHPRLKFPTLVLDGEVRVFNDPLASQFAY